MALACPEVDLHASCKHPSTSGAQQEESGIYRSSPQDSVLPGVTGPQSHFQISQRCSWKECTLDLALLSPHCTPAAQIPHSFEVHRLKNLPSGGQQSFPLGLATLVWGRGTRMRKRHTLGSREFGGGSNANGPPLMPMDHSSYCKASVWLPY